MRKSGLKGMNCVSLELTIMVCLAGGVRLDAVRHNWVDANDRCTGRIAESCRINFMLNAKHLTVNRSACQQNNVACTAKDTCSGVQIFEIS